MISTEDIKRVFGAEEAEGIPPTVREHLHAGAALLRSFAEHINTACEGDHPDAEEVLGWLLTYDKEFANAR